MSYIQIQKKRTKRRKCSLLAEKCTSTNPFSTQQLQKLLTRYSICPPKRNGTAELRLNNFPMIHVVLFRHNAYSTGITFELEAPQFDLEAPQFDQKIK
jgi:hypothetical protein